MKVLIIIPAYNESGSIESVVNNISANLRPPQYEYIIIDDGSNDGMDKIIDKNDYNHISLCTNLGIGGCVQTGYKYAHENNYDYAVQIDGDGQHNPMFIADMIEFAKKNNIDMVIGSRHIDNKGFQTTAMRKIGIKWLNYIIKICCGEKISDATSGFRLTNKKLNEFFSHNYAKDFPEPEAIVSASLNGFKIKEYPVTMSKRISGKSSIGAFHSVYYMIKVTLSLFILKIGKWKGIQ